MSTLTCSRARVLVTGGAGYIGSHCVVELSVRGYDIVVVDNYSNGSRKTCDRIRQVVSDSVKWIEADIRDDTLLDQVFDRFRPEVVIHFAALKSAGESCRDPLEYFDNNIAGTITLLKAMRSHGVGQLVFSSSAAVYGESAHQPLRERDKTNPLNPYGHTKLIAEQLIQELSLAHPDFRYVILRYFNPAGAHPSGLIGENTAGVPDNLMPYVAQVAAGLRPRVSIFGGDYPTNDGTGIRDYIHVMDLARAHADALGYLADRTNSSLIANLGTGRGYSVLEVIRSFERAAGLTIPYEVVGRRPGDSASSYADPSVARSLLGWEAEHDLERMCADAWRWQIRHSALS